jgi:homoserine kinase
VKNLFKAKKVKVFSPASVSNVGAGFDIFGFALHQPGDEVVMRIVDKPGIHITKITGDDHHLPKDAKKNTAAVSLRAMMDALDPKFGVEMELHKKMPLGSGLGSSAASSVASVFALNALLKKPFSKNELLLFALEGEKIACGSIAHADNVAPCLYGGFTLVRGCCPPDVISIPTPADLHCTIIHPHIEIKTEFARKILRSQIKLSDAVKQWGNAAALVAGLMKPDYDLIRRSIEDYIIEPIRGSLIPNYFLLKEAALKNNALGCSISGSGPSVFALSRSEKEAKLIASEMKKVLTKIKLKSDIYISKINNEGPKIISLSENI